MSNKTPYNVHRSAGMNIETLLLNAGYTKKILNEDDVYIQLLEDNTLEGNNAKLFIAFSKDVASKIDKSKVKTYTNDAPVPNGAKYTEVAAFQPHLDNATFKQVYDVYKRVNSEDNLDYVPFKFSKEDIVKEFVIIEHEFSRQKIVELAKNAFKLKPITPIIYSYVREVQVIKEGQVTYENDEHLVFPDKESEQQTDPATNLDKYYSYEPFTPVLGGSDIQITPKGIHNFFALPETLHIYHAMNLNLIDNVLQYNAIKFVKEFNQSSLKDFVKTEVSVELGSVQTTQNPVVVFHKPKSKLSNKGLFRDVIKTYYSGKRKDFFLQELLVNITDEVEPKTKLGYDIYTYGFKDSVLEGTTNYKEYSVYLESEDLAKIKENFYHLFSGRLMVRNICRNLGELADELATVQLSTLADTIQSTLTDRDETYKEKFTQLQFSLGNLNDGSKTLLVKGELITKENTSQVLEDLMKVLHAEYNISFYLQERATTNTYDVSSLTKQYVPVENTDTLLEGVFNVTIEYSDESVLNKELSGFTGIEE